MKYPVLLCLCLVFFAGYSIPVNDQNEEHGIYADNQYEISCDIQDDDQNKERYNQIVERDNQDEEPNGILRDDQKADETCSVCLLNNPDTSIGECLHTFCQGCIYNWKIDKISYRCPLCNHPYYNFEFQPDNELTANLRHINTISETLVNIVSEVMRNINMTSVFTANDLSEAIRNSNMTTDNIGGYSRVMINLASEVMRNTNFTSIFIANNLHGARNISTTRDNIANDLSEAIRNSNMTTDNIDYNSRVLIHALATAIININTTSNYTVNNTASQETNIQPLAISVFGFHRNVPNDSNNLPSDDTIVNITPQETHENTTPHDTNDNMTPQDTSDD